MTGSTLHHPDPAHPLNFSTTKKLLLLVTLSVAAWLANYTAAAHLTAFPQVAKSLDATIPQVANAIGIMILGLGTGPLLWNALAGSIGRRPTMLFSWFLFFGCTFWISFSSTYNSFAAARYFAGFAASGSQTIPATVVSETFLPERRGTAIAFWALLLLIGPVTAPIVGAAFLTVTTWRWIYYFTIILSGVVGLMIFFFMPETLYNPSATAADAVNGQTTSSIVDRSHHHQQDLDDKKEWNVDEVRDALPSPTLAAPTGAHGRIGAAWYPWQQPLRFLGEIIEPLLMARYIVMLVPSIVYAVVFMWSVGFTVVAPQVLEHPPWHFSGVAVGAAFLAAAVGSVGGKFAGGYFADGTVSFFQRRAAAAGGGGAGGGVENGLVGSSSMPLRKPEYRLWATLPQWPILLVGLLMFGLGFANELSWPAEVIGGFGVFYFANSALGGIIQTYICETYLAKSVHGIALFNFVKCCLAFAAPFFIPSWAIGNFKSAYIVQAVVVVVIGYAMAIALILWGEKIRRWQRMPML
ncbi:uncharacterized protein PFL1_01800 [Pseudozyma flocculosa PF-1]|uniref:Related to multidrug resistant protein n=1 Tax=Pseudozyma flocculosa TaxID=84751 RepID=A0A5C3EY71_9BASI|nr:uncharacterized protein PFL1_01800 [Pseudozyma flocculosa PF-1]EPQ30902.1 hypothetical protein PFL1_01800 [Pseudozyma flocculosa PF-1]SPO36715.1 related to multidrug resistant protein [Pseudozyma flocculosa]